jgi:uncharacterized ParB-like nuclease family protein
MFSHGFNTEAEARYELDRLQARTQWNRVINWRQRSDLVAFAQAYQEHSARNSFERGLQEIPVDKIVGTVSDNKNFDDAFRPRKSVTPQRWMNIYMGVMRGDVLPPIDVYKLGDDYYVVDGHHRVSVAKVLGQITIDANVIEFR